MNANADCNIYISTFLNASSSPEITYQSNEYCFRPKQWEPTSSSPLASVPRCVWGKKSPFSFPLHRLILVHWQDMRNWLMDCVSVRYQTIPVLSVLTCILQCTVVNCLKLRWLIENKVFYPQGGCCGLKHFSFRHWCHLGDTSFLPRKGGGGQERWVTFELLQVVLWSFYYFYWRQRSELQNN